MRADLRGATRPGVVRGGPGLYSVCAVGKGRAGKGGWGEEVAHLCCARGAQASIVGLERNMAGERTCGSFSAAPAAQTAGERRRVRVRWELLAVGETFLPGQARHWGLYLERG